MSSLRIGNGFDVHAFCEGRDLILGGVKIDFHKGLAGHSDADVLIHSIIDSLLGASGIGDIGRLFPDSDSKFKDISSLILLSEVFNILKKRNIKIIINFVDNIKNNKINENINIQRKRNHQNAGTY